MGTEDTELMYMGTADTTTNTMYTSITIGENVCHVHVGDYVQNYVVEQIEGNVWRFITPKQKFVEDFLL